MEIASNTTGMLAGLTVTADVDARERCVVVVKGTFIARESGELSLAPIQQPLVTTDEHYGPPETSSVRYECDFAPFKPLTDVVVNGVAVAPAGRPVKRLVVRLEVEGRIKELMVHGDRRWVSALGGLVVSEPASFTELPITFDRAFGGHDDTRGPDNVAVEPRNLVGVGFHPHRSAGKIADSPLPNVEPVGATVTSHRARSEPAGFGCIGRAWQPRVAFAGTYDARWRDERAPYLPADFDPRYFQCAPSDQQFPRFRGGETIRCVHMARREVIYRIPTLSVPVSFCFVDGDVVRDAELDTVTLEPHLARAMLVWRASVPLPKKLTALRVIHVGERPADTSNVIGWRDGKPMFAGLADTLAWLRQRRGGAR